MYYDSDIFSHQIRTAFHVLSCPLTTFLTSPDTITHPAVTTCTGILCCRDWSIGGYNQSSTWWCHQAGAHHWNHIWAASWQNQQNDCAPSEDSDQPGHLPSLISLRCPHEETLGPQLPTECTAKTLIRLGGCPGWSQSSLGAHAILLVLSWGGSYI